MYGYVLQDWITIRGTIGGAAGNDIIQGESTWMGFSSFQDMVVWLDVRELTPPTGTTPALKWFFETSPSKDNNLFTPMPTLTSGVSLTTGFTPGVQSLTKIILADTGGTTVPLATWVRWRISPTGTGLSGTWDATFRILVAANRVVRERGAGMFA